MKIRCGHFQGNVRVSVAGFQVFRILPLAAPG
jgi:hypothetical protein